MQLFKGQGVKHITEGFGSVMKIITKLVYDKQGRLIGEYPTNLVMVRFKNGSQKVSKDALLPAEMSSTDREAMEKRIADYPEMRGTRKLVLVGDTRVYAFETTEVPEALTTENGRKCFHRNHIPTSYGDHSPSPWCSLCHPYVLLVRQGAVFTA